MVISTSMSTKPLQAEPNLVSMSYSTRRPACSARVVASPTANHCAAPSRGVRLLAGPATLQSSSEHSQPPCAAQMSSVGGPRRTLQLWCSA